VPYAQEVTIMRRKLLLLLAAATLGGCAAYPYDPYYANDYQYGAPQPYYGSPYYGPGYYVAPSVGFGITYSDGYYHHHRHY
jgi:hypothetical protein